MGYIAYIFLAVAALIFVVVEFLKKPEDKRKLWGWRLSVVALLLLFFAKIFEPPTDSHRGQKEILDSLKTGQERLQEAICTIDSLKEMVQQLPGKVKENTAYLDSVRQQAECVEATEVLHTAMDSGLVAIGLGKYPEAITHLNYAILAAQDDSSKAESYLYRGAAFGLWGGSLVASGNHESAAKYCEQAVASNDSALAYKRDYHIAWMNRGNALDYLGQSIEAVASYDSALAYKDDHPDTWCNRGVALRNLGKLQEAVASYETALRYKQYYAVAWYNRGNALADLAQREEAIASYDSALIYKHDYFKAWNNRAIDLEGLGRHEEAVASADSALKYKHDCPNAWYNRGVTLEELGLLEQALASCDSALKYDPNYTKAVELRKTILEETRE